MDEKVLNGYYQRIAEKIDDAIPSAWYKAAIYAEDVGDAQSLDLYFKENKDSDYIHGGDIPEIYKVDMEEYDKYEDEIWDECSSLRREFIKQKEEPWNIFKFYLNNSGEFKAEFGYEYDEQISAYKRSVVWQYRELGIMPRGDFEEKVLNEFLDIETGELKKKM